MPDASILIVEDDGIIAMDVGSKLKRLGYQVAGMAASGQAAIQQALEARPDLILMDIRLHGEMDGALGEAAGHIRAQLDVPVVYMTGHGDMTTLLQTRITEPYGHILKPFEERELCVTLEMALHTHALKKQLEQGEARYRQLFENMPNGFAYCQMLYQDGQPDDFVYLNVNEAFGTLTGLRDVVGKRVTEVIPGVKEATPEIFETYGRVAATGQPERFEIDFAPLNIWLDVTVYCPQPGYFVAVFDNITERKRAEAALQRQTRALNERVKELNCLYRIARLIETPGISLDGILQGTVEALPAAWQYPQLACARITWQDRAYQTANFQATAWRQADEIMVYGEQAGVIEVCYLQAPLSSGLDIFLPEEVQLLYAVVERLGRLIERTQAESQREAALAALRGSETRLHTVVNSAPLILFAVDVQGRVTFAEGKGLSIMGLEPGQIVGRWVFEFLPERIKIQEAVLHVLAGNEHASTSKLDGVWVDVRLAPMRDEAGQVTGCIGVLLDVTERKQTEEQLALSLQRLSLSTRAAHIGIWDWDIRKNELIWDDRMYELYGIRREDFGGAYQAWLAGIHPDDRVVSDEISRLAQLGEQEYDTEFRVVWPDGSLHYIKANGQVVRDADGAPLRMTGINYDITERKQVEDALRQSEERYRLLFTQMQDGFALHDIICDEAGRPVDYRFLEINPAYERLTGLRAQDLIGKTVLEVLPATEPYWIETCGQVALTGRPVQFENYSGALDRHYRLTAFSPRHGQFAVVFEDITVHKQAEEQLRWELAVTASLSQVYRPLISPNATIEQISHAILEQAQHLTGSEHGFVSSIDPATCDNVGYTLTEMLQGQCQVQGDRRIVFPRESDGRYGGLWGHALNTRQAFYTNSPAAHPASTGTPQGHVPLERFLSVPVMLGQELVGQIALANSPQDYTDQDLEAIQRLAELYALAIQRMRADATLRAALQAAQQRQAEFSALLDSARAVLEEREFADTARRIFNACKDLIGAAGGYVALLTPDGHENQVLFLDPGGRFCSVDPELPMPIRGLRGVAYQTGRVTYHNDFAKSDRVGYLPEGHVGLESVLFAPLVVGGSVLGLIGLANKPGGFTEDDTRLAAAFGELASLALLNSRTLESLESSEERFRAVAQSASNAIISIDAQGRIVFWNEAARIIFGYVAEEMQGQTLEMIMPERFRADHQRGVQRVVSTGESRVMGNTVEMIALRKGGGEFPVEFSLSTWQTREGQFFTAIIRDVSARKQAEAALQRRAAQLMLLSYMGEKITAVLDVQSVLDRTVYLVQSTFGYHHVAVFTLDPERNELVMQAKAGSFTNLFPARHRIKLDQGMVGWVGSHGEQLLVQDVSADPRYINFYPDKIVTHSELSVPIQANESIVGVLDVQSTDVNAFDDNDVLVMQTVAAQLGVAIENARLYGSLQESERRFREVLENVKLIAVILDSQGRVVFCNDYLLELTGYQRDETLGCDWFERFVPPEQNIRPIFEDSLARGDIPAHYENDILTRSGERRLIAWNNTLLRDHQGNITGTTSLGEDITERRRAQEALSQSEQRYRALARENTTLLEEVNHRVGNNLALMSGIVGLELERSEQPVVQSVLRDMQGRIQSMSTIHKMLSKTQWSPMLVDRLAEQVIRGALSGSPIRDHIRVNIESLGEAVWVAPRQAIKLALILNELTTNCAKYAFGGRDAGRIDVRIEQTGNATVSLEFRDDGPGWPPEVLSGQRASVGLNLMQMSAQYDLKGELLLRNQGGAVATCIFKIESTQ